MLVGVVIRERHKRELEDTVGTQLLNIARTGALLVDPALHAEVTRTRTSRSDAYVRIREALGAMQQETLLTTPIYTLTDLDPAARRARIMVASDSSAKPGDALALPAELVEPLGWTFEDGVARYTRVYVTAEGQADHGVRAHRGSHGSRHRGAHGRLPGRHLSRPAATSWTSTIWRSSLIAAVAALHSGPALRAPPDPSDQRADRRSRLAWRPAISPRPSRSARATRSASSTRAFNEMVTGLRQRDFIRNAFGRYVSPEVAQTLLESPDGLRLGGHKREITVLMSDLRGYTRFAEQGDPARVMDVLNDYLGADGRPRSSRTAARSTSSSATRSSRCSARRSTSPITPSGRRRRRWPCSARWTSSIARTLARGGQRFEMGIGLSTGEAVVGNIGSEQRAKYAVVGAAVNLAGRVEGCTVGGQILLTPATLEHIRDLAEVGASVSRSSSRASPGRSCCTSCAASADASPSAWRRPI